MTSAYHAYSTVLALSDGGSPAAYANIAEIRSIDGVNIERDMLEVTYMGSAGRAKEYIAGMADSGMVSLELNYIVQNATHKDMLTNLQQTTVANIFRTYRIHLPDWGANALYTKTATVSSGTWTTSGSHPYYTGLPIIFSTTGTLPTTSPQIYAGTVYWIRYASTTTVTIYPTNADANADTNQITGGTGGSGTHSMNGGSRWVLTGAFKSAKVTGSANDVLKVSAQLKVTGLATRPT